MSIFHARFLPQTPLRRPQAKRNLFLTICESAITAGLLSMSIMTPFYLSIGMSQSEIALSQAIFTIVISFLNLPAGWIADRFSRKWANVIGDFGGAVSFLCYSQVHSFAGIVACECALGFFHALSQGVDTSLLKHFSHQIDPHESYFRRQAARLSFWQHCCTLMLVLIGGPIGVISFRLAIALASISQFIGGLASLLIVDDSANLIPAYRNPFLDMSRIICGCWQKRRLRLRIFAYAVGREMTHGIIWVYTPLLLFAGVPLVAVSCAWALNSLFCIAGSYLAMRYASKLHPWQIFAFPLILMFISMGVLSVTINLFTIWLYFLMGIVQGWTGATLMTLVQNETSPSEQTSIVSLAKVVSQILYIPAGYLVGLAADIKLNLAPLITLIIFAALGGIIVHHLRRE